ncbi:hypothetical protein ES703_110766 [subsurface metagenome]
MPIYEYVCSECGLKFELLCSLNRASEGASCPRCHNAAERILSTFVSRSKSDSGLTTSIGGNPCSSCSTSSCDSCDL